MYFYLKLDNIELPNASAASSTNGSIPFFDKFFISLIFAGIPNTCTGTTAAIFFSVNLLKSILSFIYSYFI